MFDLNAMGALAIRGTLSFVFVLYSSHSDFLLAFPFFLALWIGFAE